MPIWIGAYTADTMDLTTLQHGAYLLLLLNYWRKRCPLPDNDETLRTITKLERAEWRKHRPVLAAFFRVGDGVWWHKRVEAEMAKADKRSAEASAKASKGAQARWEKKPKQSAKQSNKDAPGNAPSMPQALLDGMPKQCPTPSPISPTDYSDADASGGTPPEPTPPVEPPPSDKDIVFALGLPMLMTAGVVEKNARSFLGMQLKSHGDAAVAEALRRCAEVQAIEPITWIQNFLGLSKRAAGKHSGFATKNYRQGIEEDGTFA